MWVKKTTQSQSSKDEKICTKHDALIKANILAGLDNR